MCRCLVTALPRAYMYAQGVHPGIYLYSPKYAPAVLLCLRRGLMRLASLSQRDDTQETFPRVRSIVMRERHEYNIVEHRIYSDTRSRSLIQRDRPAFCASEHFRQQNGLENLRVVQGERHHSSFRPAVSRMHSMGRDHVSPAALF
jgi:hypothetical protein